MKLFLSGNFPQLIAKGKEKAFREKMLAEGRPYHRLVTFFYPKHCETVFGILRNELQEDWHRKYKDRLIEKAELTEDEAQEALEAGMGEYDYEDDPASSADEEMSYWV